MKNKILTTLLLGVFMIGTISAMSVSFYYSDSCPYCQKIKPMFMNYVNNYPYKFGVYEIDYDENNHASFKKEGFTGVPSFVIETDDCRNIKFTGADERRLRCEMEQMTTQECPTYSDKPVEDSWFIYE